MVEIEPARIELQELWEHLQGWLAAEESRIKLREEMLTKRERELERKVIPTVICPHCNKVVKDNQ